LKSRISAVILYGSLTWFVGFKVAEIRMSRRILEIMRVENGEGID